MNAKKLSTKLIHTGDGQFCKELAKTASVPETFPVYLTSVFAFDDVPSLDAVYEHGAKSYIYSRMANPNADAAAQILAIAEDVPDAKALVFASGMAAITTSILSFVQAGDHVIASNVLYGGVYDYLANELPRFGVQVTFADLIKEGVHVQPNTKLLYTETISNPLMEVPDIAAISREAHERGLLTLVDNTFATSAVARPLALGADVALYSATKYLGGHSDITCGAVVARSTLTDKIRRFQSLYGAIPSPSDCWLLARSLRTLDLRMKKHSKNALVVAEFLESHPKVEKVFYPGLASSPSHERAKRQFAAGRFGGMFSVNVRGGVKEASALIAALDAIAFAPSLAGVATTVSYPIKTSHRSYTKEALEKAGIAQGQLRFSIGLEDANDIIEDLSQALGKL